MRHQRKRKPTTARIQPVFEAHVDHVVAVFWVNMDTSFGLRFESPEEMLTFFERMMEKAAQVWPENEWVKEWNA